MGVVTSPRPSLFQRAAKRLRFGTVVDASYDSAPDPKAPITLTISTKVSSQKYLGPQVVRKDLEHRIELWNLSMTNGPAATIIDAYEGAIFTNGWHIDAAPNMAWLADRVTARMDRMHWEIEARKMLGDGLRFGYGVAEVATTKDALNPRTVLVTRCARQFDLVIDTHGNLMAVRQYDDRGRAITELPIAQAIVVMPMVTSEGFGKSLLDQCYEPLIWWDKIGRSSADSIYRHGYPIFDFQIAGPDGKLAPADVMSGMEGITTDLNSRAELTTSIATKINELNSQGVPHIADYGDWSLQCVCASSGVPEELFGLGKGKTGLLAQSKWAIFYDRASAIQSCLETQWDDQYIDRLCVEEGGAVGDCHLKFTNPNPSNQAEKVAYLKALFELNPFDPVIDNDYVRKELGIGAPSPNPAGGQGNAITG